MRKREKQLQLVRRKIKRAEIDREVGIKLLVRATVELPGLRKQEARLMTALINRTAPEKTVTEILAPLKEADTRADVEDELEIPTYLRREVYDAAKEVANNHNKIATPEAKKLVAQEKRKVKEEHKHALLTGAKRKWPATGKDASRLLK